MDLFKTAVILAGGKSSRMGFDKQFLEIHNKKLIDRLIESLREEFEEIIIVTNEPLKYKDYKVKILSDEIKGIGPMGGFHAGLKGSSSKYVYFIACDMPVINLGYIRFMKEQIRKLNTDICVTKLGEHIETFNAFYSRDLVRVIEKIIDEGERSLLILLKRGNTFYIEEELARQYSSDWNMFLNLNTIEDIRTYLK